jgi:hypothetical protein
LADVAGSVSDKLQPEYQRIDLIFKYLHLKYARRVHLAAVQRVERPQLSARARLNDFLPPKK